MALAKELIDSGQADVGPNCQVMIASLVKVAASRTGRRLVAERGSGAGGLRAAAGEGVTSVTTEEEYKEE